MNQFARNVFAAVVLAILNSNTRASDDGMDASMAEIGSRPGVVCVLDIPGHVRRIEELAKADGKIVYFQSSDPDQLATVRKAADSAGLLGNSVFADEGNIESIHLADNLADWILVASSAADKVVESELLRVLRPQGTALIGDRRVTKPVPDGIDDWSHPYHGPDNNPQSTDQLAKGQFRTQFIAEPKFSPMPEQTVVAGGRVFKAMGHIAHKANQNEMLNTLLCVNAYNGTILWKRDLPPGFMIHRNTMIATEDALYMGDHESCKVIDADTGKTRAEIKVPSDISDGPVWKWMAIRDGVLYALVGNPEVSVKTLRSVRRGLGHWPWGMWDGHDYEDPRTAFGFGRTIIAVDLESQELLWHYRDEEFLDARALCMNKSGIYCFCPETFLACINTDDGTLLWKNFNPELLDAIGSNGRAQHYITGYATTCYMKCNNDYLFFAGPQRDQTVVAHAHDGNLAWTYPVGNLQLVLREDAIYAAGPQPKPSAGGQETTEGVALTYETGSVLKTFPARRACTRATGSVDSIFFRATGGTVRVLTESNTAQHIAPMRPPCQDGVIVSNGHLYWGPWMCGCQLSLYGHIGLCPAGDAAEEVGQAYQNALTAYDNLEQLQPLGVTPNDWSVYRGNNQRSDVTNVSIPSAVELQWNATVSSGDLPTAPVVGGDLVFVADRNGVLHALTIDGELAWKAHTSGPIYYPPAVAGDRLFVGSGDGRVYAYEARTGRPLWTFRVAPQDRMISVFGKLISRWPVAGGVVVNDDTVYAAAGITHYDGTYVVALDAATGQLKAQNTSSGALAQEVNDGVSMQGNLSIVDGELRFLGGGVYETARYDLETLACLNKPKVQVTSQFRTAFYPYYPSYGKYVSLEYPCENGVLCHEASYEGSMFQNLALQRPLPESEQIVKDAAREFLRRRGLAEPKHIWKDKQDRRFTSFAVSGKRLLAAGHPDNNPEGAFLVAINIDDGSDVWWKELPANVVKGGTAIDHAGRILVTLENGQLLCFASAAAE